MVVYNLFVALHSHSLTHRYIEMHARTHTHTHTHAWMHVERERFMDLKRVGWTWYVYAWVELFLIARFQDSDFVQKAIKMCILNVILYLLRIQTLTQSHLCVCVINFTTSGTVLPGMSKMIIRSLCMTKTFGAQTPVLFIWGGGDLCMHDLISLPSLLFLGQEFALSAFLPDSSGYYYHRVHLCMHEPTSLPSPFIPVQELTFYLFFSACLCSDFHPGVSADGVPFFQHASKFSSTYVWFSLWVMEISWLDFVGLPCCDCCLLRADC